MGLHQRTVDRLEYERKEFLDSLPRTAKEYKNIYKKEIGSFKLMIKGHGFPNEDALWEDKRKRKVNPLIYNFKKYGYTDPVERKAENA